MTWIVGTVPPFGYSILVSDIRVSWADGTERDCLQKIYKVGDDFLCGFAGSVKLGFILLDTLAAQLPRKQQQTPLFLAHNWIPSLSRRVFQSAPEPEKKLGCQLIVAAAHPTENLGDAPWPRTYVWTFAYPDFNPEQCGANEVVGIGNGSAVSTYATALREARDNFSFLKLITCGEGAQAEFLASTMFESVCKTATKGVSPFMQMGVLTRGKALLGNYNFTRFRADGSTTKIQVPLVANDYKTFLDFCQTGNFGSFSAVCCKLPAMHNTSTLRYFYKAAIGWIPTRMNSFAFE